MHGGYFFEIFPIAIQAHCSYRFDVILPIHTKAKIGKPTFLTDSGVFVMKVVQNMSRIDQVLRLLLGIAMIYYGLFDHSLIGDALYGVLLGLFGILNVGSSLVGICPIYVLAGISSLKQIK